MNHALGPSHIWKDCRIYKCDPLYCIIFFQVLQHMEDIKVREMQIFDYKKKIAEAETKLKQQQNLYEAVRSDRNLYSKNLIEAQVHEPFIEYLRISRMKKRDGLMS